MRYLPLSLLLLITWASNGYGDHKQYDPNRQSMNENLMEDLGEPPTSVSARLRALNLGLSPSSVREPARLNEDRAWKAEEAHEYFEMGATGANLTAQALLDQAASLLQSSDPIEQRAAQILRDYVIDEREQALQDDDAAAKNWAQFRLLKGDFGQGLPGARAVASPSPTPSFEIEQSSLSRPSTPSDPSRFLSADLKQRLEDQGVDPKEFAKEFLEGDIESARQLLDGKEWKPSSDTISEDKAKAIADKTIALASEASPGTDEETSQNNSLRTTDEPSKNSEEQKSLATTSPSLRSTDESLSSSPNRMPAQSNFFGKQERREPEPPLIAMHKSESGGVGKIGGAEAFELTESQLQELGIRKPILAENIFGIAHRSYARWHRPARNPRLAFRW